MRDEIMLSEELQQIKNRLDQHINNPFTYREDPVRVYNNATFDIQTDWSSQNMRRIHFNECIFDGANLASVGFTGSIFYKCQFTGNCNLDTTIFDECLFAECIFEDVEFKTTSFCGAELYISEIKNSRLLKAPLTKIHMEGCRIVNTLFIDIIWEASVLYNNVFENCSLENLNMEFVTIQNTCFDKTPIPFPSIPFIFGGLQYIQKSSRSVYVKTASNDYSDGWMYGFQYLEYLNDIELFYENTTNYFPTSNIMLYNGQIDTAIDYIKKGIIYWHKYANYKMIYYLCKLVDFYSLDIGYRKQVFNAIKNINEQIHKNNKGRGLARWTAYYNKIRNTLLFSEELPYITVSIATSISNNDYDELGAFMKLFESSFLEDSNYYSVEISHNSPFELVYSVFADPEKLFGIIVGVVTIVGELGNIVQFCESHFGKAKQDYIKTHNFQQIDRMESDVRQNIQSVQYNFYNCIVDDTGIHNNYFTTQSTGCENSLSSEDNQ